MDKKTTYGLRFEQMAGLFAMGREEPDPADEKSDTETMASLLQEQLTSTLPEHPLLFDTLVVMMDQQGYDTRPLAGRSLGEVLLSSESDIRLLQGIKDCSKRLSCTLDSRAEAALATTIYFAALASALVHHDQRITQDTYEKLEESFALLVEKRWMPETLVTLFSHAQRICRSKWAER